MYYFEEKSVFKELNNEFNNNLNEKRQKANIKRAVLGIFKKIGQLMPFSVHFKTGFSTSVKDLTSLVTSFTLLFKIIR